MHLKCSLKPSSDSRDLGMGAGAGRKEPVMNLKLILPAIVQSDSVQLPDDQEPDPKRLQSRDVLLSTLSTWAWII